MRICQTWPALDHQICPHNSDLVAYVCGGDIWVTHTFIGEGERLTYAHDGRRSVSEDPLTAGIPSYVMQVIFVMNILLKLFLNFILNIITGRVWKVPRLLVAT